MIWLWMACARVPSHLALEPTSAGASTDRAVATATDAVGLLGRRDPLVRAPLLPDRASAEALTSAPWLIAWLDATTASELALNDPDAALEQLESAWRGTPVVALTRGQRLRLAEGVLARNEVLDESAESKLLAWLTPLRADDADVGLARLALDWLGTPENVGKAARITAERWVLVGWLDGPSIPLSPLAAPLASPNYDPLRNSPLGTLLLARAEGRVADTGDAFQALRQATFLALNQAAADRDAEQRSWADLRTSEATRLGVQDPEATLLANALVGLSSGASDDRAAGGALLAHGAMRWHDTCPDAPCLGLDRVQQMATSGRWHADVAALARVWEVIALKEAIDHMDVAAETVAFPSAMVDLVDALAGTGAGPLSADLLRVRRGEPRTWSGLASALGVDGVADWTAARAALGNHLEQRAQTALTGCDDSTWIPLLDRIARRAQP